jgi:predicted Zn finger-like uncharacterized protein
MVVVCRACSASYHIPDAILGGETCRFRCSHCGHSWDIPPRQALAAPLVAFRGAAAPARMTPRKPPRLRSLMVGVRRLAAPIACVAALAGAMAAVAARAEIVAIAPVTGGLYAAIGLPVNPIGLAIVEVSARLGAGGDKSLLAVEGALVNLRGKATAAPDLRIALRAADGRELYVWTTRPPKDRLTAGERLPFVARLASPPPGVVDALVKFVAPRDKDSLAPEG